MNTLTHAAEFRAVLADYHLSESARDTLDRTKLMLLVGVTSSGRNTIIEELLKTGDYHYIVSDTTRDIRVKDGVPIEQNGREYWFRNEEEVLAELQQGEFLEAAVIHEQQVSGISIREIEKARQAGRIAITDVEPNGAETIHKLKPDTQIVFVVPPNFEDWMARFRARSDLPEDEIRRRLQAACTEIEAVLTRDYFTFVLNDKLADAVADIDALAKSGQPDADKAQHARTTAEQLYQAIQAYLAQVQ